MSGRPDKQIGLPPTMPGGVMQRIDKLGRCFHNMPYNYCSLKFISFSSPMERTRGLVTPASKEVEQLFAVSCSGHFIWSLVESGIHSV